VRNTTWVKGIQSELKKRKNPCGTIKPKINHEVGKDFVELPEWYELVFSLIPILPPGDEGKRFTQLISGE
jgi:hypothetical protein